MKYGVRWCIIVSTRQEISRTVRVVRVGRVSVSDFLVRLGLGLSVSEVVRSALALGQALPFQLEPDPWRFGFPSLRQE